ncbi:imelysin family protein [Agaribacter marinus]|uniref:Imelysin-like domain-containing protein n=1 Tax=Agaribacter marinus TaxID=1431249 RepID=A0AA37T085_9ALTE|nr:imelysin family protein [Agaribacter marinus]GLR69923.1 hypothetical protein GCM10007852_08310 [Agaribacter marinus]
MATVIKQVLLISFCIFVSVSLLACGGGSDSTNLQMPAPQPSPTPSPPTVPQTLDDQLAELTAALADDLILPAYRNFQTGVSDFNTATNAYCSNLAPTEESISQYQIQWLMLSKAWQGIQWLKIGPAMSENRLFRVQFWPDRNDAVSRGVENALIEQIPIDATFIANQNVGAQGIPALEYLLFNEENPLNRAFNRDKRCELIQAITVNLMNISNELVDGWENTSQRDFTNGEGEFSSINDALEEFVTNWLEFIELVKDEKLIVPLTANAPGRPDAAEHFRSDKSLEIIALNVNTLLAIYGNDESTSFRHIVKSFLAQGTIDDEIMRSLNGAKDAVERILAIQNSYTAALNDPELRQELNLLIGHLRDYRDHFTTGFIQSLDLNIGFNSNDGD